MVKCGQIVQKHQNPKNPILTCSIKLIHPTSLSFVQAIEFAINAHPLGNIMFKVGVYMKNTDHFIAFQNVQDVEKTPCIFLRRKGYDTFSYAVAMRIQNSVLSGVFFYILHTLKCYKMVGIFHIHSYLEHNVSQWVCINSEFDCLNRRKGCRLYEDFTEHVNIGFFGFWCFCTIWTIQYI